jgi:hypothetical protein
MLLCALAFPGWASADVVVTNDGLAVTVQGDGAANHITTSGSQGVQQVLITAQGLVDSSDLCEPADGGLRCTDPNPEDNAKLELTVHGAGGDDELTDTASWITYPITRPYGSPLPGVNVLLHGQAGNDDVRGISYTRSWGGDGNDRVEGWFGPSQPGGAGDDVLVGSKVDGNSKFAFNTWGQEPGADVYVTRSNDHFEFDDGPVTVSFDAQPNDGRPGEGDNVGNQAGMVWGSVQGDLFDFRNAQGGVWVAGLEGDDAIYGSAWPDTLVGGPGIDRIDAAGGDDVLGLGESDHVFGGAGRDEIYVPRISGRYEGPGFDISLDGLANDGERGSATSNVGDDIEIIHGSDGNDRLVGGAGAQELHGLDGDDEIAGGAGPDLLYGDAGADQLRGRDAGWDLLDCGDGADPAAEGDEGDHLANCELFALAPLPPATDTRAPFVGIKSAVRGRRSVRIRALVDERGVLRAEIRSGGRRVGRATFDIVAGVQRFSVRLRRGARVGRTLTITLRATDAAGNATTRTRRIRLRR